jgi:hypothetical protein
VGSLIAYGTSETNAATLALASKTYQGDIEMGGTYGSAALQRDYGTTRQFIMWLRNKVTSA